MNIDKWEKFLLILQNIISFLKQGTTYSGKEGKNDLPLSRNLYIDNFHSIQLFSNQSNHCTHLNKINLNKLWQVKIRLTVKITENFASCLENRGGFEI